VTTTAPRVAAWKTGGMPDSPMDLDVTDHLLATTRSVRRRLDLGRPVEPEVILECLRLAVQAPTAGNAQGWRWLVVTDAATRRRLAEIYAATASVYLPAAAEAADDPQTKRVYQSALFLNDVLADVPVHVIPCSLGRVDGAGNFAAAAFYGSILPAVWSFMLALRARGLGSAWTTLHLAGEREAAELLGIPEDVSQVALIPVAYTTGGDFRPAARPPVEGVTYWDHWGATR